MSVLVVGDFLRIPTVVSIYLATSLLILQSWSFCWVVMFKDDVGVLTVVHL